MAFLSDEEIQIRRHLARERDMHARERRAAEEPNDLLALVLVVIIVVAMLAILGLSSGT